ncbi:MAG: ABC transporter substrate-binding protein [Woeseia sp.]
MAANDLVLLRRQYRGVAASLLVLLAAPANEVPAAEALPPEQVIATTADSFATVVATRYAELEADLHGNHALVDEYLLPQFDFTSACRLILRGHWKTATPEQQQRFVDAFYRFLLASYGEALLEFRHDTVKVLPPRENTAGASTRVRTEMKMTDGSVFNVDFYMRLDDRGWRIVDVIAEGVSYVRTYRSEFGLEIRADSLDALTARLEDVAAKKP